VTRLFHILRKEFDVFCQSIPLLTLAKTLCFKDKYMITGSCKIARIWHQKCVFFKNTEVFVGSSSFSTRISQDVNGDGLLDMVLQFTTGNLNLTLDDTQACLTGATLEGQQFIGCDDVSIIK